MTRTSDPENKRCDASVQQIAALPDLSFQVTSAPVNSDCGFRPVEYIALFDRPNLQLKLQSKANCRVAELHVRVRSIERKLP